jgi:hypothetical protein
MARALEVLERMRNNWRTPSLVPLKI